MRHAVHEPAALPPPIGKEGPAPERDPARTTVRPWTDRAVALPAPAVDPQLPRALIRTARQRTKATLSCLAGALEVEGDDPPRRTASHRCGMADNTSSAHYEQAAVEALDRNDFEGANIYAQLSQSAAVREQTVRLIAALQDIRLTLQNLR